MVRTSLLTLEIVLYTKKRNFTTNVDLFIGAPRRRDTKEQVPLLKITDSKGLLTLELTAYPTPHVASTTYNDSRDGASVEDTVKIVCVASKIIPAFVTCNITVVNLSHSAEGFYSVIFRNSLGNFTFVFRAIRNSKYILK